MINTTSKITAWRKAWDTNKAITFLQLDNHPDVILETITNESTTEWESIKDFIKAHNGKLPKSFCYHFYFGNGAFSAIISEGIVEEIQIDEDILEIKPLLDAWGVEAS